MPELKPYTSSNGSGKVARPGVHRLLIFAACIAITTAFSLVGLIPTFAAPGQPRRQDFEVHELQRVKSVTLQPTYTCRSSEDFQKGYERTALFISKFSRDMNSPELLFEGACRGSDFLFSASGGDSMDLIEDMGEVPLENVAAQSVFLTRGIHFDRNARVQINHTYAVLLNQSVLRGLFVFTVVDHVPNERLDIRYAVKEYQILSVRHESPGFDWGVGNL